jgi:hypothetical protein
MRNAHNILVGVHEGKKVFRRHTYRRKDTIEIDLKERECEDVGCIHMTEGRVQWNVFVSTVIKIRPSQKAGNFLYSSDSQEGFCSMKLFQ